MDYSLRFLEGQFLSAPDAEGTMHHLPDIQGAAGVMFMCPKCYTENKGRIGTHYVICWFVGKVPDDLEPKPGRWNPSGNDLDSLTFVPPGAVSVLLTSGCLWHGFVRNGMVTDG